MPARRWGSGLARLRSAPRSVRRQTRTTILITTHTGTPTRRRPIIHRHLIILRRAAAGTPITDAITHAECRSIRFREVANLRVIASRIKALQMIVFGLRPMDRGQHEDDQDFAWRLARHRGVLGAARLRAGCTSGQLSEKLRGSISAR